VKRDDARGDEDVGLDLVAQVADPVDLAVEDLTSCAAGEVEAVRDYGVPAEDANLVNPFPANDASLTRGEELYKKSCIDCHGEEGRGDGLAAKNLDPHPSISALII
jgi:cytochrome c5